MRSLTPVLLLLVLLLGNSCDKDIPFDKNTPVDTLFPKPYYPIYPGSWWQYQNLSNSSLFTQSAGPYTEASIAYGDYHSQPYIVPTMDGEPYFGYGVHRTFSSYYVEYPAFSYILSETQGDSWDFQEDYIDPRVNGGVYIMRRTDSVGLVKTMNAGIFTDVIRVSEHNGRPPYQRNYYYYAKDVGLIEWGTIDASLHNAPSYRIDSYFINH